MLSGINDTQAGGVAAGTFSGTHAGLALGTTAVIVTHLAKKKVNPLRSLYTMPSPLGDTHMLSAENGVAGVAVDYFLDTMVYPDDPFATLESVDDRYAAFNAAAAASKPGAAGVLFLPWLRGSLAPHADGRMRGGFLNVGLDTTRNDLARAVLEGVALNLRWLQGPVEKFIDREISHYVFYGGGARPTCGRASWPTSSGSRCTSWPTPASPTRSAPRCSASTASGSPRRPSFPITCGSRRSTNPTCARARYDDLAATFAEAFKRTRPLSHRLAKRA